MSGCPLRHFLTEKLAVCNFLTSPAFYLWTILGKIVVRQIPSFLFATAFIVDTFLKKKYFFFKKCSLIQLDLYNL